MARPEGVEPTTIGFGVRVAKYGCYQINRLQCLAIHNPTSVLTQTNSSHGLIPDREQ